jgi:cobalt-zinc-cadmium efflux system protein
LLLWPRSVVLFMVLFFKRKLIMSHQHNHTDTETSGGRLFVTMTLNFIITIAEVIGGIISGSLSLISDALHNFSDGIAIIISYIAIKLKAQPKSSQYTFGLKRAEILAAVINSSVLIVISFFLLYEAYQRFMDPSEIQGGLMMIVASVGLLANVAGTLLLKKGSEQSINIRSTYLHLLSDAVSSVAVIIGGAAIYFWNIYWIDPVLTVLISIYIIKESFEIVKEAINVIMMGSPSNVSMDELKKVVEKIDGVTNLHHVHLWRLDEHDIFLEAHVEVKDMPVSDTGIILDQLQKELHDHFDVTHTTIQFECDKCDVKTMVKS